MGGLSSFWNAGIDLWNAEGAFALINGVDADFTAIHDENDLSFYQVLRLGFTGNGDAKKFGLLYSTIMASNVNTRKVSEGYSDNASSQNYVDGPFLKAAYAIDAWYDPDLVRSLIPSNIAGWTNPTWTTYTPGDMHVPSDLADLLNAKTQTYISEVSALSKFLGLFSALVGADPTFENVYTAVENGADFDIAEIAAGTVIGPEEVEIVLNLDAIALSEPSTKPSVSDPSQVTMTDVTAAAILAFTADLNARYSQKEAELLQRTLGARYTSAGSLETKIAALEREKERELAAYIAELDINKMNKNADLELEYQRQMIEVDQLNGDLSIRHGDLYQRHNIAIISLNQLKLAKEQANADFEQRYYAQLLQASIAQVQANLDADRSNEAAKADHLRANVDLARALFDATGAWMHNKLVGLTNSGALADVIKTGVISEQSERQFERDFFLRYNSERFGNAIKVSGAIASDADLRFKSVIQNQMVIKEALAAQGIAYAGTERNPSGFENLTTMLGMGLSGAGSIANVAAMFA